VTSPFEDEHGTFYVLMNDEGQHSLWPSFLDLPDGWSVVSRPDSRAACLEFVAKHWTDMRPNSLVRSMNQAHVVDTPAGGEGAPGASERDWP
jgi:MbtH protein